MVGLVLASYRQLNPPARPGSVAFHEAHFQRLRGIKNHVFEGKPEKTSDWMNPKTWRWWLLGSHDLNASIQSLDEHTEALLRLGHFQKRDVYLKNDVFDPSLSDPVLVEVFLGSHPWIGRVENGRSNWVEITATPANADRLEAILRDWDSKQTAEPKRK